MRDFLNKLFGGQSIRERSEAQWGKAPRNAQSRRQSGPQSATKSGAEIADEIQARTGHETRAKEIPAWALLLHSPFEAVGSVRSWIGGTPKAPAGFDWPRHPDGTRQHFVAQIDLEALDEADNHGLPRTGALLIFMAYSWSDDEPDHGFSCKILTAQDMQNAVDHPVPSDLAPLNGKMQFYHSGPSFPKRGVHLVRYNDDGHRPPKGVPYVMNKPSEWLTNWGLARVEAEETIRHFDSYLRGWLGAGGQLKIDELEDRLAQNPNLSYYRKQVAEGRAFRTDGPAMLKALEAWRDHAAAQPALAEVQPEARKTHFVRRAEFASLLARGSEDGVGQSLRSCLIEGSHEMLWEGISHIFRDPDTPMEIEEIYRDFVHAYATGWRGHRLFGVEPVFPNNAEDLRGQDSLISLMSDVLIGTECEHFYGVSLWCPSVDLAAGRLDRGQVIRHCAV